MGSTSSKIEQEFQELGEDLPEKYIGLENKGSTCYANAVIQSLYFCKEFRKAILAEDCFNPGSLASTLRDLFIQISLHKKQTASLAPKRFCLLYTSPSPRDS